MSKLKDILWTILFFSVLGLAPLYASAHTLVGDDTGATLSILPAGGSYLPNDNFTVSVLVNTNGQNVVVVAAYLFYDKTNFQAVSVDLSGSDFTNTFENMIDPTNGEIKITQAKPSPGVNSPQGLVAKINFKALNPVTPNNDNFIFDFTPGSTLDSNIVLDDGHGTDIISGVYNEKFIINQTSSSTSNTTAPSLSNGAPIGSLPTNTDQTTLSLDTDELALCRYSTTPNTAYASMSNAFSDTYTTVHAATLSGLTSGQSYTYYIKCADISGNINTADYLVSFSVASPVNSSSGGGGGGGNSIVYIPPAISTSTVASTSQITPTDFIATSTNPVGGNPEEEIQASNSEQKIIYSFLGLSSEEVEKISLGEAETIFDYNHFVPLDQTSIQLYHKIIPVNNNLTNQVKFAIAYYLQNGSNSTKRLGAGERAGTLNSYQAAFNKMPQSLTDWQNIIKVANGRWPAQTSPAAENQAQIAFNKIYQREVDQNNNTDVNAIKIAAYGLRPIYRNANSEKNAIATFKSINGQAPASSADWNLVRTIAYSGAKK